MFYSGAGVGWWYRDYDKKLLNNPVGAKSGTRRVYRGGSWIHDATACLSDGRFIDSPFTASELMGFRLVFVP